MFSMQNACHFANVRIDHNIGQTDVVAKDKEPEHPLPSLQLSETRRLGDAYIRLVHVSSSIGRVLSQ